MHDHEQRANRAAEDEMLAAIRASINWPEKMDDVIRIYNRWATQAEQQAVGFDGLLALGDRDTGQGMVIALYDSPESMTAAGEIAESVLTGTASLFAVPPIREQYDVIIHALPKRNARLDDDLEYARVTTIRVRPETIDQAFELIRTTVLANAQRQRGHRGFLGLGNRATGKTMHFTFWDSESAMYASETSGHYQNQVARIAHFLTEPPTREIYDVIVRRLGDD
jgi:heme-degrading monooxygenase HmoA